MSPRMEDVSPSWPELPYAAWKDTYATLHLWTQIVGKIRLAQTPWLNHSWHVTFYVSPRGLTTSTIPYGTRTFELEFDFSRHVLSISTDDGSSKEILLSPRSVAEFYADVMQALSELGIDVQIYEIPNEIPDPIRFTEDRLHCSYDPLYAQRFWQILVQVNRVLYEFRTAFIGKCSNWRPSPACREYLVQCPRLRYWVVANTRRGLRAGNFTVDLHHRSA
jgi:uncharacterized protein DUF5996